MSKQKFLKPKPKYDSPSWKKRNEARSVLQEQHAKRTATIAANTLKVGDTLRIETTGSITE